MKKIIIVLVLAAVLTTGTAFADHPDGWGVGVLAGFGITVGDSHWNLAGGYDLALSLKAPVLPIYWGISAALSDSYFGLGVTGDVYLIDMNIIDTVLGWYLGVGGFVGLSFWDYAWMGDGFGLSFGARVPVGLSVQIPVSSVGFEFFASFVPRLGLGMIFWDHWDNNVDFMFNVGGEVGIRFWF